MLSHCGGWSEEAEEVIFHSLVCSVMREAVDGDDDAAAAGDSGLLQLASP